MPYLWQFKEKANEWKDFDEDTHKAMESWFASPNVTETNVKVPSNLGNAARPITVVFGQNFEVKDNESQRWKNETLEATLS